MFWKNSAWSWDDDDDGGFLLAADLRKTPDSAPDADQNSTGASRSKCPPCTLTGPKDPVQPGVAPCRPLSLDSANANVSTSTPLGASQHLPVSTRTCPGEVPGPVQVLKVCGSEVYLDPD